ncbi:MAG: glutathione S-transferase family protein [Planctomycetes bacterium]|nr:glutathione S-transferase family protein [Planctomycetota bacterium]
MADVIVYGASFSPFVRKLHVLLDEKNVAFEAVPVSPRDWPAELRPHSPLGKIPLTKVGNKYVPDSSVAAFYLERKYPSPALYPTNDEQIADALWFEEYIDGGVIPKIGPKIVYQRIVRPMFLGEPCDEAIVKEGVTVDLPPILDYLEKAVVSGGGDYLVGGKFSIADITVVSCLINLGYAKVTIDATRWPNVARYLAKTTQRPSFAKALKRDEALFAAVAKK